MHECNCGKHQTLAARASRICLKISPRRGAGTSEEKNKLRIKMQRVGPVSVQHLRRKTLYASRVRPMASCNSCGLAVFTRASTSPVVGHTEVKTSPDPRHC